MAIGRFLWVLSGKLLRVSIEDIKLPKSRGGLGLLCLSSMGKSLRLSQTLRLLKNGDAKCVSHIWYWMGAVLQDLIPEKGVAELVNVVPTYYEALAEVLVDARMVGTVCDSNWKSLMNQIIYKSYQNNFSNCKIEKDIGKSLSESWRRLHFPCLTSSTREILFLIMHNKLPMQERLFRVGMANDP